MAQAARTLTIRFPIAATLPTAEVIDLDTGEIISAAEAHRRALLRQVWANHAKDGSAL